MQPSHQHGGQLKKASEQYNIPLENWIDLSTGINPNSYPLPDVPASVWQRLPEVNDGLEAAAATYYGSASLLPVSGSQEAIQKLPLLRKQSRVGIISPAYHSHKDAWTKAGHQVTSIALEDIESQLTELDVLLLVNPTNPTTERYSIEQLQYWHAIISRKGGWMIVDEAFMDLTPEGSLIQAQAVEGLIVLRSIGKFFGLAGVRLGFVWAPTALLQALAALQDDWSVSNPARWAGRLALSDFEWQRKERLRIPKAMEGLKARLQAIYQCEVTEAGLFAYVMMGEEMAREEHERLCANGVLTRFFPETGALRFGLSPTD
ncbi:threonine-phosphate decarboxylase [Leucothrix sargassi]|nr:threonine-phosphate decarboxylase [Leucothrix sargassi]